MAPNINATKIQTRRKLVRPTVIRMRHIAVGNTATKCRLKRI